MALLDLFKKKPAIARAPRRLAEVLSLETPASIPTRLRPPAEAKTKADDAGVPAGIDFASLWEEPSDPSMLSTIFSGISGVLAFITMLIVIFK